MGCHQVAGSSWQVFKDFRTILCQHVLQYNKHITSDTGAYTIEREAGQGGNDSMVATCTTGHAALDAVKVIDQCHASHAP